MMACINLAINIDDKCMFAIIVFAMHLHVYARSKYCIHLPFLLVVMYYSMHVYSV